ncbi:MAG: hypothetical protein GY820_39930 [Gammaproteobacteria bacterium]|nr:hypothetical protein [Gammaproteobacteria bacterium]
MEAVLMFQVVELLRKTFKRAATEIGKSPRAMLRIMGASLILTAWTSIILSMLIDGFIFAGLGFAGASVAAVLLITKEGPK